MNSSPFASIIVPCRNEAERLHHLEKDLDAFLTLWQAEREESLELILVDDASTDATLEVQRRLAATLQASHGEVLERAEVCARSKRGHKGGALQTGVAAARGRHLLTMDADAAISAGVMLQWLEQAGPPGEQQIYLASRLHPTSRDDTPWLRRLLGRGYNALYQILFWSNLRDTQCGFKLYPAALGKEIFASLEDTGWAHDIEVLGKARILGAILTEMPVRVEERPGSRVNLWRDIVGMFWGLCRIRGITWRYGWRQATRSERRGRVLPRILLGVTVLLLLLAAVGLRTMELSTLPGINGDEAWFGVQMWEVLHGEDYVFQHGQARPVNPFINPLISPPRPISPFYAPLMLPLLEVFEPGFWILRAPAVLSGLLAIAMAFLLFRYLLDPRTAGILALLVAASPVAIAYSRFGWEPSQTILAALFVVALALRRSPWSLLALVAAVIVHPTNIFLLPVLVGAWLGAALAAGARPRRVAGILLGLTVLAGAAVLLMPELFPLARLKGAGSKVIDRLDLSSLADMAVGVERLVSGATVYEFIVGPLSESTRWLHDAAASLILVVLLAGGTWLGWRQRRWRGLGLGGGLPRGPAGVPGHRRPLRAEAGSGALRPVPGGADPGAGGDEPAGAAGPSLPVGGAGPRLADAGWLRPLLLAAAPAIRRLRPLHLPHRPDRAEGAAAATGGGPLPRGHPHHRSMAPLLAPSLPGLLPSGHSDPGSPPLSGELPVIVEQEMYKGALVVGFSESERWQRLLERHFAGRPLQVWEIDDGGGRPLIRVYRLLER